MAMAKLRFPRCSRFADDWPVQLAINGEVGAADTNSEQYAFSGEVRPIAELHWRSCRLFVNPNLGVPLGHDVRVGPSFEPEAKANCTVVADLAPGLEYYSLLGPVFDWLPIHQQTHYLFYTVDFYRWSKVELSVGVGQPLTLASGSTEHRVLASAP